MPKLGKKFRTLHKFGQRRKKKTNKGKIGDCGDGDREQTNSAASSSASDPADTTTASSSSVSVAVSSSSSTTPGASTSTSTETSSLQETLTQKPCSFKRKMDMFTSSVTPSDSEDEYDVDTSECAKKKAKKKADAVDVDETDPERQNLSVIFDINCLQSLVTQSGIKCPHCNKPVSVKLNCTYFFSYTKTSEFHHQILGINKKIINLFHFNLFHFSVRFPIPVYSSC